MTDSKCILLFPKRQILDSNKLKEFADNNFEFDENGRKFSKQVENTIGSSPHSAVGRALDLKTPGCAFHSHDGQPNKY